MHTYLKKQHYIATKVLLIKNANPSKKIYVAKKT